MAWSFSRTRSLITIEPQILRVWSCCEPPKERDAPDPVFRVTEADLTQQAADAIQWVELVSGQFFQKHESRFKRSGTADQMLLNNLKEVRLQLQHEGLDNETIHDLLARIIFIQFLFQKQDSQGTPALNESILQDLYRQGILSKAYRELPEILDDFDDTYQLFRWLNNKFNGDLFPGKGETPEEREDEWQAEIQKVRTEDNRYLNKLAQFVRGDLEMQSGQLCLWKFYSFDVIPLDFISSIYEEFVNKKAGKGVHYTPEYIVDFILDGVLPWNEKEWDLKILDPACGSGIFLVKAFQRLIYRWETAHDGQRIPANVLRTLLENNIFGVDIDKEAVRVASFSLYLTMLDSIEPLEYWENEVRFPRLRNQRLINYDFFAEDKEGFRTNEDTVTYDLVLGNAPWGRNTVTSLAKNWAKQYAWDATITYGNIGPLFLPKALALTKPQGLTSMIQPAGVIIFNQIGTAQEFRRKLFTNYKVEEIVNLSALRFGLFKNAISPCCVITLCQGLPDNQPFPYICPKPSRSNDDDYYITIDAQDVNEIYPEEALNDRLLWSCLMWGGRRDLNFIRWLSRASNFGQLEKKGIVATRQGIIRGDRKKEQSVTLDKRILEKPEFPDDTFLFIRSRELPINLEPKTHSRASTDFSAFDSPQMIIKMSWQSSSKRFQAAIVETSKTTNEGILCSGSYVSINISHQNFAILEAACLSYNSKLAVYYLLLSSPRFANYIPEVKPADLLRVPIPASAHSLELSNIQNLEDVDEKVFQTFSIKESERILIEDLFDYTLPDFKGDSLSPGRQPTHQEQLKEYCKLFIRVIKSGFGSDKEICATIFQELADNHLPIRLVAIYLNKSIHDGIKVEPINSQDLLDRLNQLNKVFMEQDDSDTGGIFYQRVARVYASTEWHGEQIPTVYLIKPDKIRYWTRSMALRDADKVSADIMLQRAN
ncbi:MAG: N-6 DNA methylase [Coleofasciculaceae cyanobacterium]